MSAPVPDPMTPASYETRSADVAAHDHAVCVYESPDELLASLAHFVRQGMTRKQLSVFVHSFDSDDAAWTFLEKAVPGARGLDKEQVVLVSLYRQAFEGDKKRIDFDRVASVLESLLDAARTSSRAGTRIFVDASRVYFREERAREWFEFESWLGRRLHHDVGLVCAYQKADATRADLFPDMLRTHAYRFQAPD